MRSHSRVVMIYNCVGKTLDCGVEGVLGALERGPKGV